METISINVTKREKIGKGASNESRRSGFIHVMYYNKKDNIPLLVDSKELTSILKKHLWSNTVLSLTLPGKKKETMAIIKEIQQDPISRKIIHTDFCEVSPKERLKMTVKLKFIGIPVGVKLSGGILNCPRNTVVVECPISMIPETIDVDISGMDIGHTLHVKDLVVPEGITIVDKERLTIATVNMPKVVKSEQETAAVEGAETAAAAPATGESAA